MCIRSSCQRFSTEIFGSKLLCLRTGSVFPTGALWRRTWKRTKTQTVFSHWRSNMQRCTLTPWQHLKTNCHESKWVSLSLLISVHICPGRSLSRPNTWTLSFFLPISLSVTQAPRCLNWAVSLAGSDQSSFVTAALSGAKCKKSFAPATVLGWIPGETGWSSRHCWLKTVAWSSRRSVNTCRV